MPSMFHAAVVSTVLLVTGPALADVGTESDDRTVAAETPSEATQWSSDAQGLALGSHFGVVGGSFLLGGNITSPWFAAMLRVNVAMGAAFYPHALASDATAAWTPFGFGHARLEVGTPFLRSAPIRPYAFGGLVLSVLPSSMSNDQVSLGGVGGLGIEAGFPGHNGGLGPVAYALEFSGVGSGATVATPTRGENLLSGFAATALIRGYFW